jgi:hypothetical protein
MNPGRVTVHRWYASCRFRSLLAADRHCGRRHKDLASFECQITFGVHCGVTIHAIGPITEVGGSPASACLILTKLRACEGQAGLEPVYL